MTIRETLDMGPGAIITLDKMTGEPVACATRWTGSRATATHSRPGEVALDFHLHATALARTTPPGPGDADRHRRRWRRDLLVNGRRIARGEVVAIDEEFGLRVTQIVTPEARLDAAA